MDWVIEHLFEVGTIAVAATIVSFVWSKIREKWSSENWDRVYQFVEAAVNETYTELVRGLKENGGKLTVEQKRAAATMAYNKAIEYAKKNGFDLLKTCAADLLPSIIEMIVKSRKS